MLVIRLAHVSHTRQLSSDNSGQPVALGRKMVTKHEEQDPVDRRTIVHSCASALRSGDRRPAP